MVLTMELEPQPTPQRLDAESGEEFAASGVEHAVCRRDGSNAFFYKGRVDRHPWRASVAWVSFKIQPRRYSVSLKFLAVGHNQNAFVSRFSLLCVWLRTRLNVSDDGQIGAMSSSVGRFSRDMVPTDERGPSAMYSGERSARRIHFENSTRRPTEFDRVPTNCLSIKISKIPRKRQFSGTIVIILSNVNVIRLNELFVKVMLRLFRSCSSRLAYFTVFDRISVEL